MGLYAKGLTTRDIQEIVKDLYGVDVSPTLVSQITAALDAEVTAWRQRRLEPVWPIVYLDGITVHVRDESGRVSQHTMHVAVGVNLQGKKELLGPWLSETEGAKFWLSCLTDLKNRGLQDLFIVCVDGLSGFAEAIRATVWGAKYPTIVKQWRLKWNDIITLFEFPPAIRKAIYTTNVIESINSVTESSPAIASIIPTRSRP